MAFWNQTQIEELQIENRKLTDQLGKCNRELIRYKYNEIIKTSIETERLQKECNDLKIQGVTSHGVKALSDIYYQNIDQGVYIDLETEKVFGNKVTDFIG